MCKRVLNEANDTTLHLNHQIVTKIVDGDGFLTQCSLTRNEFEFRLLGIDAPEIKYCSKLKQDEKETHIPAQLLIHLGKVARCSLASLIPPGTSVILKQESTMHTDIYGRYLVYAYLPSEQNTSINEIMVRDGYAKPYDKVFCKKLPELQLLYTQAKLEKRGLFAICNNF